MRAANAARARAVPAARRRRCATYARQRRHTSPCERPDARARMRRPTASRRAAPRHARSPHRATARRRSATTARACDHHASKMRAATIPSRTAFAVAKCAMPRASGAGASRRRTYTRSAGRSAASTAPVKRTGCAAGETPEARTRSTTARSVSAASRPPARWSEDLKSRGGGEGEGDDRERGVLLPPPLPGREPPENASCRPPSPPPPPPPGDAGARSAYAAAHPSPRSGSVAAIQCSRHATAACDSSGATRRVRTSVRQPRSAPRSVRRDQCPTARYVARRSAVAAAAAVRIRANAHAIRRTPRACAASASTATCRAVRAAHRPRHRRIVATSQYRDAITQFLYDLRRRPPRARERVRPPSRATHCSACSRCRRARAQPARSWRIASAFAANAAHSLSSANASRTSRGRRYTPRTVFASVHRTSSDPSTRGRAPDGGRGGAAAVNTATAGGAVPRSGRAVGVLSVTGHDHTAAAEEARCWRSTLRPPSARVE